MTNSASRTCAVCRKSWCDRGVNDLPECYQLLPSDVSSEALHCRPHNSQQLFWCLVCKEKLCRKCLRHQHRTCDWVLIEEQAEDLKAEVIGKISETEIKIKDSLDSIDNIIKENKTILDLYKTLRKVLAKMNGEYTIYQQRILLLQSKLNRQTSEIENLRTDWAIPPGSDLMCAVKEKMESLQEVQAVIMWPEKPHMRCFNGLIDNFQKCRDSNYSLTDVCEGLDLPLSDDESEADGDDEDNEEEVEDVDQEQDSDDEEEAPNADDSIVTAIETVSSVNLQPENPQFLPTSSAVETSNISVQVSSENTLDTSGTVPEALTSSGARPLYSWLTSSTFGRGTRSVQTQFSLRPIITFFGDSSTRACPFPFSTSATLPVETTPAAVSEAESSFPIHQQQTNASPDSEQLENPQDSPAGFNTALEIRDNQTQSGLNLTSLFAPARANENGAEATSAARSLGSLLKQFPEVCSSTNLPKFPSSLPASPSQFNITSSSSPMVTPSSKFEGNVLQNFIPTQSSLSSCGFGTTRSSSASIVLVTTGSTFSRSEPVLEETRASPKVNMNASESCSQMNTQAAFANTNNGAESAGGSASNVNATHPQSYSEATVGAPMTTAFATFKFQSTIDEVQTSTNHKVLVLEDRTITTPSLSCLSNSESQHQLPERSLLSCREPGFETQTSDQSEVDAQLRLESIDKTATEEHIVLPEAQLVPSSVEESNLPLAGGNLISNESSSPCTQETADGGEPSILAAESSNSGKKINFQTAVYEDNNESSCDSASSSPRTDTLSRDVTDEDSVRGQMRMIQSSDLLKAFKNAIRELRRLKKSLKGSKLSKTKKEISENLEDCATEARIAETTFTDTGPLLSEGACGSSVRPKRVSRDAACSPVTDNAFPSAAASLSSPAAGDEGYHPHKTLHSEYRKFLRRGGPFRRRFLRSASSRDRTSIIISSRGN
ncbi:hypothetical protein FHG87_011249 [Trinorchestia longiramus]|nr:hypothetical protein FHG87_011249 [Trinorchestia longiramus]